MTYPVTAIPGSLIVVFVAGVLLAVLYYRTGNLFVAIGFHALINAPTMVVGAPAVGELTALVLVVLIALVWPWIEKHIETESKPTVPVF
ncbi:CPBP family glutamic-type intramembrane protease [Haladaptatus sp. DFWS20]|uniref:CPBP family glutamic-type intramembrane protease n=1 Tax=Haladaptatus sp. DFWS20 TaxID=3403467 RepID=UPI003EC040FD